MRSHGQQVGAGLGGVEREGEGQGFAVGQLHAVGHQAEVFFVVVVAHFVVELLAQLHQVLTGRPHAQQTATGGEQARKDHPNVFSHVGLFAILTLQLERIAGSLESIDARLSRIEPVAGMGAAPIVTCAADTESKGMLIENSGSLTGRDVRG